MREREPRAQDLEETEVFQYLRHTPAPVGSGDEMFAPQLSDEPHGSAESESGCSDQHTGHPCH